MSKNDRFIIPLSKEQKEQFQDIIPLDMNNQSSAYENQLKKSLFYKTTQSPFSTLDFRVNHSLNKHMVNDENSLRKDIVPKCVLDAPGIVDDFYNDLIDWGKKDLLAVGLAENLFIRNMNSTNSVSLVYKCKGEDIITSVAWSPNGNYLAFGTDLTDTVFVFDVTSTQIVAQLPNPNNHCGTISWASEDWITIGGYDHIIRHYDLRNGKQIVGVKKHQGQICSVKWNPQGNLLASGGNDDMVYIWNRSNWTTPYYVIKEHKSAVRALDWSPWKANFLATGGGMDDGRIICWDLSFKDSMKQCISTNSQVCKLIWSKDEAKLLSTHGIPYNNIIVWSFPSLKKIEDIRFHKMRVLYASMNASNSRQVCTASGEEKVAVWELFKKLHEENLVYPKIR